VLSEPCLSLAQLEAQLLPSDLESTADPVLIMMSGLPGSGKSHLSRILAERVRAVVIESDAVRKMLFPRPCYSAVESAAVHRACQQMMRRLLTRGGASSSMRPTWWSFSGRSSTVWRGAVALGCLLCVRWRLWRLSGNDWRAAKKGRKAPQTRIGASTTAWRIANRGSNAHMCALTPARIRKMACARRCVCFDVAPEGSGAAITMEKARKA
jgi:hypothetical protein